MEGDWYDRRGCCKNETRVMRVFAGGILINCRGGLARAGDVSVFSIAPIEKFPRRITTRTTRNILEIRLKMGISDAGDAKIHHPHVPQDSNWDQTDEPSHHRCPSDHHGRS